MAFSLELPYRLINMYSLQGETVLDPFWGTGTTTLAAMASARNPLGVEFDGGLLNGFDPVDLGVESIAEDRSRNRLSAHWEFVAQREEEPGYDAEHYDTKVVTRQERGLKVPVIGAVDPVFGGWDVEHGFLVT